MNINLDSKTLEQCLKEVNNIGGTIYRNICTGESKFVEWGTGDWAGYTALALIVMGLIGLMVSLFLIFPRDY